MKRPWLAPKEAVPATGVCCLLALRVLAIAKTLSSAVKPPETLNQNMAPMPRQTKKICKGGQDNEEVIPAPSRVCTPEWS